MNVNNKYNIWDSVNLISLDNTKDIYTIYSITISYWDIISYTIWRWTDYESVGEWQIELYVPPEPIWLQTKE